MFGRSKTLFRVAGIDIKVDASWFIIAMVITWSLATSFFPIRFPGFAAPLYWGMGVVGALGLFASIIFHELAHSLVALRYGLPIKSITLFIFGGVAEIGKEPPHAMAEFNIAIAGPLASLFLSVVFFALVGVAGFLGASGAFQAVMNYLGVVNALLAVFNMIPAFPLDGGRVFRAVRWWRTKDYKGATETAAKLGGYFGLFLIFAGVTFLMTGNTVSGLWYVLIGLFLRGAASNATAGVEFRRVFSNKPIKLFMERDVVHVTPEITVRDFIENYMYRYHYDLFPVLHQGELMGCITTQHVRGVPPEARETTRVSDIYEPCSEMNSIHYDVDAAEALMKMQQQQRGRLLVVDGRQLVGVVVLKDLLDLLSLRAEFDTQ